MPVQSAALLDTERNRQKSSFSSIFSALMAETGDSLRFVHESLKLIFGPGRVTFDEYLAMRLWDPKFYSRLFLGEFAGNLALGKICKITNFVPGAESLVSNKIASSAAPEAYGLHLDE